MVEKEREMNVLFATHFKSTDKTCFENKFELCVCTCWYSKLRQFSIDSSLIK